MREFIHAILRRELSRNPTTVFFTGHSLGGALATFAALDVTLHTVPRVNAWLKHQEKYAIVILSFVVYLSKFYANDSFFSSFSFLK